MPPPASPAHGKALGLAALAAVLLIWTGFMLVARGSAAHTLQPVDIAALRFSFSGLLVLPFVIWKRQAWLQALGGAPRVALLRALALTATAGFGYCSLTYTAFFLAPVSHAAVLLPGSLPLWTALISMLLLSEKLTAARWAGLALIVAGEVWVGAGSLWGPGEGGTWRGDLLFLGGSLTWALYGVLCRRWRVSAVAATAAVAVGSLLAVPPYALAVASGAVASGLGQAGPSEIAFQAVFQGGVSMLLAGAAFTQALNTFGPMRTTMATAVVPAVAALAAVPVLGEPLHASAIGGLACVTLGLMVGTGLLNRPSALRPA